jgi:hypothetical protein
MRCSNYIKHGHVEIAPTTNGLQETYYLPHHLVKKDKRGNVKWRIVFDGGTHERDTSSLNSTLEMGPNLLPELPEAKKTVNQVLAVCLFQPLFQISRFSSYWKVLHITAFVSRFIHLLKRKERPAAGLTASEIHEARTYWIRAAQSQCFAEERSEKTRP